MSRNEVEGLLAVLNMVANLWHIPFCILIGIYADKIKIYKLMTLCNILVILGGCMMIYDVQITK
jgi:hypothetical protein